MGRSIPFLVTFILVTSGCGKGIGSARKVSGGQTSSSSNGAAAIVLNSPAANTSSQGAVQLNGTCTNGLVISISGDVVVPVQAVCASNAFSAAINLNGADGAKQIQVSQTASDGRIVTVTRSFFKDTLAPVVALTSPALNAQVRGSVVAQGGCESGVTVQLQVNSTNFQVPCANSAFATTLNLSQADGPITLVASQVDGAGNTAQSTRNLIKDTVAPMVAIASPDANATVGSQSAITGSCENGLNVTVNGAGVEAPVSVACAGDVFSALTVFTSGAGAKVVQVSQTDAAGNTGTAARTLSRQVDAAPVVAFTSPAANSYFQNGISVSGTCQTGLTVSFSGAGWMTPATATCATGTFSAAITFTAGDGVKNLIASQTSNGATGSASRSFNRDTTAPVLNIMSPAANSLARTSVNLIGSCENGLVIQISGSGSAAASTATCANGAYNTTANFSAGEGAKTIQLVQTDLAGNATTVSRIFTGDSVIPNLTITSPAANADVLANATVTGGCEGTFTVTASGTGLTGSVSRACAANAYSIDVNFSSGEGVKAVTLSQTDSAGNTASINRTFMRAAPVLDGAVLYATNCASCHGTLVSSTKQNRTSSQISGAITSIAQMNSLSFLSTAQRDAIAAALVSGPTSPTQAFACDQNQPAVNPRLLRLSKKQILNTVQVLMNGGFTATDLTNWTTFNNSSVTQALVTSIPNDGVTAKGNAMIYDTGDQRISDLLVRNVFEYSLASAQWLISDSARLNRFVRFYSGTSCSAETVTNRTASSACIQGFINGFGLRALRRPVETVNSPTDATSTNPAGQNDMAFYQRVFSNATYGGFDSLIAVMLSSPDTLFVTPFKGSLLQANVVQLTNFEIAEKLSYYFTDSPPDQALITAAQANFTGTGNTVEDQANRLFALPKARERFMGFYSQWMRPQNISNVTAPPENQNINLTNLRNGAVQEILDMSEYYTFGTATGKPSDLAASDISFARNADLAQFYGVPAWIGKNASGGYDASSLVRFPASAPRGGMFTRAAYLFSGTRDSNIILRGAHIRRDFLCHDMTPPANTEPNPGKMLVGLPTNRNVVDVNTSGASCIGCHAPSINPLGFALENYDAFGRFRTQEPLFDSAGNMTQYAPIDAVVQPRVSATSTTTTTDGVTFSQHLGQSTEFNACFVRHYFRFSQARAENVAADGCNMQRMYDNLTSASGGGIQTMIKSVVRDTAFRQRSFTP